MGIVPKLPSPIHEAARIQRTQGNGVAAHTLSNEITVDIVAADLLVHFQKLVDAECAAVQSRQTVLPADVVLRFAGETCFRIASINVGAHLLHRAANACWIFY